MGGEQDQPVVAILGHTVQPRSGLSMTAIAVDLVAKIPVIFEPPLAMMATRSGGSKASVT